MSFQAPPKPPAPQLSEEEKRKAELQKQFDQDMKKAQEDMKQAGQDIFVRSR